MLLANKQAINGCRVQKDFADVSHFDTSAAEEAG